MKNILQILADHWFAISSAIIFIAFLVCTVILFIIKIPPKTNLSGCGSNNYVTGNFITDINIITDDDIQNTGCTNSTKVPVYDSEGNQLNDLSSAAPFVNACYSPSARLCDDTNIVVDVSITDMSVNGKWQPPKDRCQTLPCYSSRSGGCIWFPANSIYKANDIFGIIPSKGDCSKKGLCISSTAPKYMKGTSDNKYVSAIKFVENALTAPTIKEVCGAGWDSDLINIRQGCANSTPLYLCKSFSAYL